MSIISRILLCGLLGIAFVASDTPVAQARCVGSQCAAQRQFRGAWLRSRSITRTRAVAGGGRCRLLNGRLTCSQ